MTTKKAVPKAPSAPSFTGSLTKLLSANPVFMMINCWIVGDSPLIVHAWSKKAKLEMLGKQVKAARGGRAAKDPEKDFLESLYEMGKGTGIYGFPATGIKKAIAARAHKDKGLAKTEVKASFWIEHEMVSVQPAVDGATCDLPLVRIHGSKPVMREDMVKIGSGLNKIANLAYRAQFKIWAIQIKAKYNPLAISAEQLCTLIFDAGKSCGIGEWRTERDGVFGSFHLANEIEEVQWDKFAAGEGPLPLPPNARLANAAE